MKQDIATAQEESRAQRQTIVELEKSTTRVNEEKPRLLNHVER